MGRKKREAIAAQEREQYYNEQAKLNYSSLMNIRSQRAEILDPSSAVTDISDTFFNPYANLGVATQAAKMQMEQTDAALANTLDTLRATGSGAGGATALAQAALQSKREVTASIEQQEAKNQQLKADGDAQLQKMVASEKQRVQAAKAAGMEFTFSAEEARTNADLDFYANQTQLADDRSYQALGDYESSVLSRRRLSKDAFGSSSDYNLGNPYQ